MNAFNKIIENKNLFICLIVLLLIVSAVQGVFLIKLYRSVDRNNFANELTQDLSKDFGLKDELFEHFDPDKWDPLEEFRSMQERMDRMFDDSYNRFKLSPFFGEDEKGTNTFIPQTDLIEEDDRYIVKMNIPGSEKAEIQVDVQNETLNVKAKTQVARKNSNDDTILRMERRMGSFQRTLTLPGPVDSGAMETEYEDGVLTIILPKQKS